MYTDSTELISNNITKEISLSYAVKNDQEVLNLNQTLSTLINNESLGYRKKNISTEIIHSDKDEEIKAFIRNRSLVARKGLTRYYSNNYYKSNQSWIGTIISISDNHFTAKLEDVKLKGTFELAEFEIDEISLGDRSLINLGSMFYWNLGYKSENGQITKESLIRFQRLPSWTTKEMDEIIDEADHLFKSLNVE